MIGFNFLALVSLAIVIKVLEEIQAVPFETKLIWLALWMQMKLWYAVLTCVNVLPDDFSVGSKYPTDETGNSVAAKSSDTTKPLSE